VLPILSTARIGRGRTPGSSLVRMEGRAKTLRTNIVFPFSTDLCQLDSGALELVCSVAMHGNRRPSGSKFETCQGLPVSKTGCTVARTVPRRRAFDRYDGAFSGGNVGHEWGVASKVQSNNVVLP
jgi:hypothetical protein